MKRFHLEKLNDADEEAGEPAAPANDGGRASGPIPGEVRSSGVYPRDERDASPPAPCLTFEEICERYSRYVWIRIQRPWLDEHEAKDIFQKVFVDLLNYTRKRGVPREPAPVLLTIIAHQICNYQRERACREKRIDSEADADTLPSSKPGPEQAIEYSEGRQKVEAILARMSPNAALVFRLVEIERMSTEEVAELLDRSDDVVRVQLCRARATFRELAARMYNLKVGDLT